MSDFEYELIDWISARCSEATVEGIEIGPGDDGAVLSSADTSVVLTTDTICDGVHFELGKHTLRQIGHKTVAVNISDILAMGGCPKFALLTFFLPKSMSLADAKALFLGAEETAQRNGVAITGGDTNRYDGPLIAGATLVGYVTEGNAWRMNGARPGDEILVTGTFGGSILGKHIRFEPRTEWVRKIASSVKVNAATDITDSLSLDLSRLLRDSNVGAEIFANTIPVSPSANELATRTGKSAMHHALTDGEDFELLLVVDASTAEHLIELFATLPLTRIGKVLSKRGLFLREGTGLRSIEPQGFVH